MNSETPIANCAVPFRFECPKLWENLDPTTDPDIRFCQSCRKDIYLCHTMEQVARHTQAGDCIAVRVPGPEMIYKVGEAAADYNPYSTPKGDPQDNA
jgi:hypothetical protein